MNGGWSIAIAQDAADSDDDDVAEQMLAITRMAWVGEGLKVRTNRFDIDELCHGNILEIAEHRRAKTFRARRSLSIQRYGAPTYGARPLSYAVMRAGRDAYPFLGQPTVAYSTVQFLGSISPAKYIEELVDR